MTNVKTNGLAPPSPSLAYYDFYKTNGTKSSDLVVMPDGPSMTRQEFAEECDINAIMRRYEVAGAGVNYLPRDPNAVPQYVDLASAPTTLLEFMDLMANADKAFMSLPAGVRREFDNDPIQFVEYASDPANLEQMREWKLAPPAPAPAASAAAPGASAAAPAAPAPAGSPAPPAAS